MRLLLLPGMDGTGRLFEPLLSALPPTLSAVAVSYPPDQPFGYDELLPLVEAAAAECSEFVVVGESFSGPLALMLAARRPTGLRGVVLCASFVRFPLPVPERWRGVVRPWMFRLQPLWLVSWVLLGRHGFGRLGRLLREALKGVSPIALAARAKAVAGVDVSTELQSCPLPVLYLQATSDWVIRPGCWELVHKLQPGAEAAELPGPHLVLQVSPSEAARALEKFCGQLSLQTESQQVAPARSHVPGST